MGQLSPTAQGDDVLAAFSPRKCCSRSVQIHLARWTEAQDSDDQIKLLDFAFVLKLLLTFNIILSDSCFLISAVYVLPLVI